MFTGIVEELGRIVAVGRTPALGSADAAATLTATLTVRAPLIVSDLAVGGSVAVNGVCLTAVEVRDETFTAELMAETLRRSTLAGASAGAPVNLERPLTFAGRLGGHLVQGHVDALGQLLARQGPLLTVRLPARLACYVVPQGSIAIDGVSLTVVDVSAEEFSVSLIPATLAATTLGSVAVGDPVNLEVDVIAKYVARMMRVKPDA